MVYCIYKLGMAASLRLTRQTYPVSRYRNAILDYANPPRLNSVSTIEIICSIYYYFTAAIFGSKLKVLKVLYTLTIEGLNCMLTTI